MKIIKCFFAFIISLNLLSCSEYDNRYEVFETATGTQNSKTGSTSSSGDSSSDKDKLDLPSDDDDDGNDEKYDFMVPDGGIDEEKCNNIDFLFVIDDSGSMNDKQMSLVANFPVFVNGIQNYLPTLDEYHVGIITTDAYSGNPTNCQKLGALVSQTTIGGGCWASEEACGPYANGSNYITNDDDLNDSFSCAAQVGACGNNLERPLASIINANDPFMQSPGQCNEGFSREDALLVIVIVSDEDDYSGSPPQDWYDHLVWIKGNPNNIVAISLVNDGKNPLCGNAVAENTMEFTNKFKYGFIGDICMNDYSNFYYSALLTIYQACYDPIE